MIIYGAGLAGLLAAHMLRRHRPVIHEAQPYLPNNHRALLRFRSDVVSRVTGIPFRRVWVQKALLKDNGQLTTESTLRDSNAYSLKVTDQIHPRSIITLDAGERFIAPDTFIAQLAAGADIVYEQPLTRDLLTLPCPVARISTIPMPMLMQMMEWTAVPAFTHQPITSVRGILDEPHVDVYQTIYSPYPNYAWYRASITGHEIIVEFSGVHSFTEAEAHAVVRGVAMLFGITRPRIDDFAVHTQTYGKLVPIADVVRRSFILAVTDRHQMYSVGRFATWRQILLDDVVHDLQVIERFINDRDQYQRSLHYLTPTT